MEQGQKELSLELERQYHEWIWVNSTNRTYQLNCVIMLVSPIPEYVKHFSMYFFNQRKIVEATPKYLRMHPSMTVQAPPQWEGVLCPKIFRVPLEFKRSWAELSPTYEMNRIGLRNSWTLLTIYAFICFRYTMFFFFFFFFTLSHALQPPQPGGKFNGLFLSKSQISKVFQSHV